METFDWSEELPIDYARLTGAKRQEWLERLLAVLARETGSSGKNVSVLDSPFRHRAFSPLRGRLTTELRITEPDGPCLVTGRGVNDGSELAVWSSASDEALASMDGSQLHRWSALISAHPDYRWGGLTLRLRAQDQLGSLVLTPIPVLVKDVRTAIRFDQGAYSPVSYPIRVDGATSAWHPAEARRLAAVELRLACAVMTVGWHVPMAMRVAPLFDERDPTPYLQGRDSDREPETPPYEVQVDDWMTDGLARANAPSNFYLADALGAHLDAHALEWQYPSQACIAYVAVIESLGKRLVPAQEREANGSTEAFRRGLDQVLYVDEATRLAKAYRPRSSTAHGGRVHGTQASLGVDGVHGFLADDRSRDFEHLLMGLQKAARRLLTLELGGPQTWQLNEDDMPRGLVVAQVIGGDNWLPSSVS
jgi:hypothetical protein